MIRHVSIALMLLLTPTSLLAQSAQFTVTADSAGVYRSPSTGSPVIGHASHGAVLQVTRELGSWVRIAWPAAQDGVAYVHVSTGSISRPGLTPIPAKPIAATPIAPTSQSHPPAAATPARVDLGGSGTSTSDRRTPVRTGYVAPPAHAMGFGGQIGLVQLGFGGSARLWSRDRFGLQLEASREAFATAGGPERMTSIRVAPSALVSSRTLVRDYFSMRPYAGAGVIVSRHTLAGAVPIAGATSSDRSFDLQAFGGGEATFASAPQFAVSADVGYRRQRTPFPGFDVGGIGVTLSGHWYVK